MIGFLERAMVVRRASALLAIAVIMGAGSTASAGGPPSWAHSHAVVQLGGASIDVGVWLRGQDAVVREAVAGTTVTDSRCIGNTLTVWMSGSVVIRRLHDAHRCFALATQSVLVPQGLPLAGAMAGYHRASSANGKVVYESEPTNGKQGRITTDARNGLILDVQFADGRSVTVSWDSVATDAGDPPAQPAVTVGTETYADISNAAAAKGLMLPTLPQQISGFSLTEAFSYQPSATTDPMYYAIWTRDDGAQVQIVSSPLAAPAEVIGLTNGGGRMVFGIQEGARFVQIYAPDRATMVDALAILRPGVHLPA